MKGCAGVHYYIVSNLGLAVSNLESKLILDLWKEILLILLKTLTQNHEIRWMGVEAVLEPGNFYFLGKGG